MRRHPQYFAGMKTATASSLLFFATRAAAFILPSSTNFVQHEASRHRARATSMCGASGRAVTHGLQLLYCKSYRQQRSGSSSLLSSCWQSRSSGSGISHHGSCRYFGCLLSRRTNMTIMRSSNTNSNGNNREEHEALTNAQQSSAPTTSPLTQKQQLQQHHGGNEAPQNRADFLRTGTASLLGIVAAATGLGVGGPPRPARAIDLGGIEFGFGDGDKFDIPPEDNPDGLKSPRPLAYRVEYTDPPTTVPFPKKLEVK